MKELGKRFGAKVTVGTEHLHLNEAARKDRDLDMLCVMIFESAQERAVPLENISCSDSWVKNLISLFEEEHNVTISLDLLQTKIIRKASNI